MPDIQVDLGSFVTSGTAGSTSPAAGTSETWTVAALGSMFPTSLAAGQTISFRDATATAGSAAALEMITMTATTGPGSTSITVTRGVDGTTPAAHSAAAVFVSITAASSFLRTKLPYYAPRGLQNDYDPTTSSYNCNERTFRRTRQALGKAAANAGVCHIVNTGDSSGIGYNGTAYVSGNAFPRQFGMALAEMLGVRYSQGIVPANSGAATNDQWAVSGGGTGTTVWTTTPQLLTLTAAGYVEFQPDIAGDAVQIFYSDLSGAATYQIETAGVYSTAVTITTTGTATMKIITITGLSDGLHKVRINWTSGTFYMGAARLYSTASGVLHMHNLCAGGTYANLATAPSSASKNWSDTTTTTALGTIAKAYVTLAAFTPDLHMTSVGNNDHNQAVAPATIVTGISNLRAYWPTAEFLDVHAWMVTGAVTSTFDTLCGLIYGYADSADIAHVDWNSVVGGSALAITDGATGADNIHPIDATSIFFGRMLARIVGSSLEATVAAYETHTFSFTGALAVTTGQHKLYNPTGRKLRFFQVRASVGTAPTGAAIIVDLKKNGTTIFTGGTGRPTIPISGVTGVSGVPAVTTWEADTYLTVDITQIGSTVPGSDLTVQISAF